MSQFFRIDRVNNNAAYNRLMTLEYLFQHLAG
jgi:hypothetical protein